MRVTLRPIPFVPVPVVRPVPRVVRSLVDGPALQPLAERPPGEGRSRRRRPVPRQAGEGDAAPPPDPAATLAATLVLIALDRTAAKG